MKENKNIEFLNSIYQIAEMGVIGINDIIDKVKKSEFREFLESQKNEYEEVLNESEVILSAYGAKEKELGKMTRLSSKMMSEAKTLNNSDDKVIADMMIKGTTKGIKKIETKMNEYDEKDKEAYELSLKLLRILKNNIERLKIYL